jgi:hypothetical protein
VDPFRGERVFTSALVDEIQHRAVAAQPALTPAELDAYELGAATAIRCTADVLLEQGLLSTDVDPSDSD